MSRSSRKRDTRTGTIVLLIIIAGAALAVRGLGLELRPVHGDEANQAYKTGKLLETGHYVYDPHDHHGPTLYYLALAPLAASGAHTMADTETWMLRAVPVVFSAATLLLFIPLRHALPPGAAICAALILACSPAFTFYARYYIQETLLVFFTFAAIMFGWKYTQYPTRTNAIGIAVALCLMHATKETAVLAWAAMGLGLAATLFWRYGVRESIERIRGSVRPRDITVAVLVAAAISAILFSAFFTHWRGPLDSILTYKNYLARAGGAGIHDKPWYYYLSLLAYTHRGPGPAWSEGAVLALGLFGVVTAFWRLPNVPRDDEDAGDPWLLRFIAIYTLTLLAIYSLVPYKTPWSLLSFYFGIVVLAGVAVARGIALAPPVWRRVAVGVAFVVMLAHLGLQSWRAETTYAADVRNPWVYAHTSTKLVELVQRIDELAALDKGDQTTIQVIQPDNDYWPLPWYLRKYKNTGYWNTLPGTIKADIIVSSPRMGGELRERLGEDYFGPSMYSLRPAVLRELYVRKELWDAFMARPREPATP